MNTKKTLYIISILIIIVSIYFLISKNSSKSDLPNCARLYTGNVVVEIKYPNKLTFLNRGGINFFFKKDKELYKEGRVSGILSIRGEYYELLDDIINSRDPGPKYKKITFNGYDAALGEYQDEGLVKNRQYRSYRIPLGNRVIDLHYIVQDTSFELYEKMLRSISFMQTNKDVKEPRVEKCE